MNGLKLQRTNTWKSCAGMCVVCGAPLELFHSKGKGVNRENADEATEDEIMQAVLENDENLTISGLQENGVRVALFRYGLLFKLEDCHVIDRYTMLHPKTTAAGKKFLSVADQKTTLGKILGPNFKQDVLEEVNQKCVYDEAQQMCERLVDKTTVPGCAQCNSAMNWATMHAHVTYRCYELSNVASIPALENRSQKSTALKKVIQQVAFFFNPPSETNPKWSLKQDLDILLDTALYRCAANLAAWSKSGAPRFRMIAVFYGAWYIYHTRQLGERTGTFVQWHLHVFREYYMTQFPTPGTWFGFSLVDAGDKFDINQADCRGWLKQIGDHLEGCADGVCAFMDKHFVPEIVNAFQMAIAANVSNELTLFLFACHHLHNEEGIETLLSFFAFNVHDPMCALLSQRFALCVKEIKRAVTQYQHDAKNKLMHAHGKQSQKGWLGRIEYAKAAEQLKLSLASLTIADH